MQYTIHIGRSAEKELDRLPHSLHAQISRKIISFEENPRPRGIKKLSGRDEYRVRVGDYRILFVINDKKKEVLVVAIGNRRDIYR